MRVRSNEPDSDRRASVGDWYINTCNNKRVAVVALEDWGYPVELAVLQYEDGTCWDEVAINGELPGPYKPFPTGKNDAPTLDGACPDDEHVFDAEPDKYPRDEIICKECRLSMHTLLASGEDIDALENRVPHICHTCEKTLEVGDKRILKSDSFLCPSCHENH